MKLDFAVLIFGAICNVLGAVSQDPPILTAKIEQLEARFFKESGAKRVKTTYGPFVVPASDQPGKHGSFSLRQFNAMNPTMPCKECLVTGWTVDVQFADTGKSANANENMWLHHVGVTNLNRTDSACLHWPERIFVNGNERSPFDLTLNGTRKAGYYIRETDQFFMPFEIMNSDHHPKTVNLVIEWEYIPGTPADFDIATGVWLDVKGNCLSEPTGVGPQNVTFTVKSSTGWTSRHTADILLMVSHIHDGNTKQEIFLEGNLVCESIPLYGETAEYVTHQTGESHGHDHGGDEHIYHVSSISQCTNVGKLVRGSRLSIQSHYDMELHVPQMHNGGFEAIMAIQFVYVARPRDEAMRDILASKNGDYKAYEDQIARNLGKTPEP